MFKSLTIVILTILGFIPIFGETGNDGKQPYFIENKGQWDNTVRFVSKNCPLNVVVSDNGLYYDFYKDDKGDNGIHRKGQVVLMEFVGSEVSSEISGSSETAPYFNFFKGNNPTKWASGCRTFNKVVSKVYENIEAVYYFDNNLPRYDFVINPGANPEQVRIKFIGADIVDIKDNKLTFSTQIGTLYQGSLTAYQ